MCLMDRQGSKEEPTVTSLGIPEREGHEEGECSEALP